MDLFNLIDSTDGLTIEKINYCQIYLVDLLGFLVQEQNQNTENSPSVKVNSLPELGKNQVDKSSRSAHISKSLPSVGLTKMSSENTGGEVASKAKQKRSRSPYVMEVVSDEGTATPAYSDDFTDVSSIDDDDERKTKSPEEVEREINLKARVEDSISDVKKARQKLNSPQQKVLTSAISTLEGLVKQLKDDIQNTKSHENAEDNTEEKDLQNKLLKGKRHDSLVTEENQENLIEILEEKEVIIDDLTSKIQESAAVIEERNQIVEKLLNRLLIAEEALNQVKEEHVHVCDSVKDWYEDMERTIHNKDSEMLRLTEAIGSLEERLRLAENSATKWRVKYLNIEANHLNLKKNLATGRGAHVISPVHDFIPAPPDVRDDCPKRDDESTFAIAYVSHANDREFKDSPYSQPYQPAFLTELNPREAVPRKERKSSRKASGSHASSSAPSNTRGHLPKLREKSRKHLKPSIRQAYGLSTTESTDKTPRRASMTRKTYPTLPSISTKRK